MNLDDILGRLPVDQIAGQLGIDPQTARSAVDLALPALVGGMQANAQDPAGAQSLANALGQHDDDLLDSLLGGDRGVDQLDTQDGSNIVTHVFGDNQEQVVSQLAGASGAGNTVIAKLLPMLAPIVMSFLAKRVLGGGGGLADILGQVLGGGQASGRGGQASGRGGQAGGIDIGDLLGDLLGGGRR